MNIEYFYTRPATPVIERVCSANAFMRTIAGIVAVTFTMLILAPTAAAANNAYDQWQQQKALAGSDEKKLAKLIGHIDEQLGELESTMETGGDSKVLMDELSTLAEEAKTLDQSVKDSFASVGQMIKNKKLPLKIQQRHDAAVARYESEMQSLLSNLQTLQQASTKPNVLPTTPATPITQNAVKSSTTTPAPDELISDRMRAVKAAREHLKGKKHKRSQQRFDPNHLPNQSLKPDPDNKPKTHKNEFIQSGLIDSPTVKLAALGDFTFSNLTGANNPAYLAATDEVVLSQTIKDQAAALSHDPVKIYHWVRNNIEWLPSWGAIQNAELTLSARRGNAFDIASLTIALLRASQIPARYVHGTIEIPAAKFMNWAGGFTDIRAAIDYAASGGIPTTGIVTAGTIQNVQIEHIWVEAAIDYFPSRGAANKDADSWISLNPSFKQYDYLQGLDVIAISGINPDTLAQNFIDSGTVNEAEGWVTGFNPQILQDAQTQTQTQLESYINTNLTNPTVGDVIGGRKTIIKEYPILPSGIEGRIITTGARYDKIPKSLQQQISYAFYLGPLGELLDQTTFAWPTLNNEKVTLSFKPATADDEAALAALLPTGQITDISQLPTSIPAYLIEVIPELKVNGTVVKSGSPMNLGEEIAFTTEVTFPNRSITPKHTYNVIAGSYLAVNVIAGSVSSDKLTQLQSRLQTTKTLLETNDPNQIGNLTREDLLGDLFQVGSLGYYAQYITLSHIAGLQAKVEHMLASGTGTIGYEPNVDYFFGFPRAIEAGGVAFDIPLVNVFGMHQQDNEKKKQFTLQTGILSSALEHAIPELMFASSDPNAPKPDAISAVKALQKASAAGQRIYQITQANMNATLPNIRHDRETMDEIRIAVSTGKEVITHTDAVTVPGWSGAGYIIFDPVTGEGAYKISGGGNGGALRPFLTVVLLFLGFAGVAVAPLFLFALILTLLTLNIIYILDSTDCGLATPAVALQALMLAVARSLRPKGADLARATLAQFIVVKGFVSLSQPVCELGG